MGPCDHSWDDINCCIKIAVIRESAGLSLEGVYDHKLAENNFVIPLPWWDIRKWSGIIGFIFPIQYDLTVHPEVYIVRWYMALKIHGRYDELS